MISDYTTTGISIHQHPVELLRPTLEQQGTTPIAALPDIRHGTHISVTDRRRWTMAAGITLGAIYAWRLMRRPKRR
ncbi:MAG TPA: hypothetical protein VGX26_02230 [Solirubrobacteraceae bacterium]|jgi:hypothetical protein|nr:hypothetical protein [Solirubrobacteraceae bacterium]